MGSSDFESSRSVLKYNEFVPGHTYNDITNVDTPLTYRYAEIDRIPDQIELAKELLDDRMIEWLESVGYKAYSLESDVGSKFLSDMSGDLEHRISTASGDTVKVRPLGPGTPVLVERHDPSDPRKKINIVFAVGEISDPKRSIYGEKYLLLHPVDVDEMGVVSISRQTRTDTDKFAPPVWTVEPLHPFGFRGGLKTINSYPLVDKI
jgi:hypothetical protein